ncbi:MAG TPA: prepilin-type N-terminal cleavage/methylation domain-containing protein [Candidatus Paceibacterota bacterium]|nr:prepilin-type N-terminal cleavage/methylation domain-containing protein [Candidatus Paceibacterota bacterium]
MESISHLRVLRGTRHPGGFTLIEMLVVLAIIIIVTAIALAGQSGFNRTEALNNMAYDIGLTIRQAESYGISNIINGVGLNVGTNIPYGVAFDTGWPASFVMFGDTDPDNCDSDSKPDCQLGDHKYSSNDTTVQTYALNNGFTIHAFCVSGPQTSCTTGNLQKLAITFSRPNARVTIAAKNSNQSWITTYTFACIELYSQNKETRYVSVSANGEILAGNQTTADPGKLCPST